MVNNIYIIFFIYLLIININIIIINWNILLLLLHRYTILLAVGVKWSVILLSFKTTNTVWEANFNEYVFIYN